MCSHILKVTKKGKIKRKRTFQLMTRASVHCYLVMCSNRPHPIPLTCSAASGAIWLWSKGTANCIFLGLLGSMAMMRIRQRCADLRPTPSGIQDVSLQAQSTNTQSALKQTAVTPEWPSEDEEVKATPLFNIHSETGLPVPLPIPWILSVQYRNEQ